MGHWHFPGSTNQLLLKRLRYILHQEVMCSIWELNYIYTYWNLGLEYIGLRFCWILRNCQGTCKRLFHVLVFPLRFFCWRIYRPCWRNPFLRMGYLFQDNLCKIHKLCYRVEVLKIIMRLHSKAVTPLSIDDCLIGMYSSCTPELSVFWMIYVWKKSKKKLQMVDNLHTVKLSLPLVHPK